MFNTSGTITTGDSSMKNNFYFILGEGAIINGSCRQEKRRERGSAYCTIQEKGGGFGNPAGGP